MRITFTSIASLGLNQLQRIRNPKADTDFGLGGEMITVRILTKKRAPDSHFWEYDAEITDETT